jgi:hypothetical protein
VPPRHTLPAPTIGSNLKLILRPFRFRQTQEYKNGAVERLHFVGGQ